MGGRTLAGRGPGRAASPAAHEIPEFAVSVFLDALQGRAPAHMPVWFMRQAGRALAEYRAIRADHEFDEVVHTPELTVEVTLQPVRRYGVDAAILFSDIVTPVQAVGLPVEIRKGVGPVLEDPIRTAADLDRLRPLEPDVDVPYVLESVRLLAAELADVPLIGFAGAPFTLASYLVEGRPSRNHALTKSLMHTEPVLWDGLMTRLADLVATHLRAQVDAGASAVQLFDSWAGTLSPDDYRRFVLPHSRRVLTSLADLGVPRIHFGVGTGELLGLMAVAGADVVGVDWRVPLDVARHRLPDDVATQGNLDPTVVVAGAGPALAATDDVLARVGDRRDHVFNLGHGVLPATDPGVLADVVAHVHESTAR